MNFQIQVLSTQVETKPTQKGSYQQLEVAYKDLTNGGKVASKKVMSFASKAVFEALANAKPAEVYDIEATKNEKTGYWDWTTAKKGVVNAAGPAVDSIKTASPSTTRSGGNWETPEERAKKQVYIVRQSSISAAISALTATGKVIPKPEEVIEYARQLEAYVFDTEQAQVAVAQDIEHMEENLPF